MKSIEKLVKKVISESMTEKAEEMTKKIHDKLSGEMAEEWGDYDFEYEEDELTDKARFAKILKRAMEKKGYMSKDEPKTDELEESMPSAEDYDYVQAEGDCMEGDCGEMEESMARGEGEKLMRKYHQGAYDELSRIYKNIENSKDQKGSEDKDEDGEMGEELHGNQNKIDVAEPKGKITGADFKKLRSMKKETDEEMEEGNAFSGALAKAKEEGDDTFEVDGKEYDVKNESRVYSIEFKGGVLKLTENELVDMIEELVIEQKAKSKGMVEYDRVHAKDSNINKEANKASFKKMKEYVKAGSKGNFEPNPKHFPKGNGELAKMDKKAYKASDAVEEYVDTFAYGGGMLDLDPDEIGYNEDWLEKTIEGSAMTGNSPEYANADDTGLGKKLNKRRKEGLYNQEKRQNSYKRVKQPVDVAGENTKSGKLNKMFKNLGESEEKKEILSEEMVRMKEMIGYNKKSQ
jgi:hypothetical protein